MILRATRHQPSTSNRPPTVSGSVRMEPGSCGGARQRAGAQTPSLTALKCDFCAPRSKVVVKRRRGLGQRQNSRCGCKAHQTGMKEEAEGVDEKDRIGAAEHLVS